MKVIYIAGPYRAANAWEVEQNIRKVEDLAFKVAEEGHSYICPHTNSRYFDGTITDKYWLEMTLELMRRCDAVLVAAGWQNSSGTMGEIAEAKCLELPVFYSIEGLLQWIHVDDSEVGHATATANT